MLLQPANVTPERKRATRLDPSSVHARKLTWQDSSSDESDHDAREPVGRTVRARNIRDKESHAEYGRSVGAMRAEHMVQVWKDRCRSEELRREHEARIIAAQQFQVLDIGLP